MTGRDVLWCERCPTFQAYEPGYSGPRRTTCRVCDGPLELVTPGTLYTAGLVAERLLATTLARAVFERIGAP